MTTLHYFFIILGFMVLLASAVVIGLGFLIHWVAAGESDVNGDPERDAGFLDPHSQNSSH
jgi:hypothetical protein